MNRRSFLGMSAAAAALAPLASARAALSGGDRKFLFVFADGGWDPTRVFAPEFANPSVSMEASADRASTGDLAWVDHPDRPSVRAFMEAHASRTLVFNGVLVRSVAHDICRMIAMTGDSSGSKPDWPAILSTGGAPGPYPFTVPHLVLGGPSFAGPLGAAVSRTGGAGQLEALVNGDIVAWSDQPPSGLPLAVQHIVDRHARGRAQAQALRVPNGNAAALYRAYAEAVESATDLKDLKYVMDFTGGTALVDQTQVAVDALSSGISRCITMSEGSAWDTHDTNDPIQSQNFESLFSGLNQLMEKLEGAPGSTGGSLADETTVVVLSEMGRTPLLNGFLGKDHWPYTSVMVVGSGVTGGRVVGGFDDLFYGRTVDPGTGEAADGAQILSVEAVGATLLALADIDPAEHVLGVDPIVGVLS